MIFVANILFKQSISGAELYAAAWEFCRLRGAELCVAAWEFCRLRGAELCVAAWEILGDFERLWEILGVFFAALKPRRNITLYCLQ